MLEWPCFTILVKRKLVEHFNRPTQKCKCFLRGLIYFSAFTGKSVNMIHSGKLKYFLAKATGRDLAILFFDLDADCFSA
jgi:hypothetical protein